MYIFINMAKAKVSATSMFKRKSRRKRPGVHAKTKRSVHKHGKNYEKKYRGQGK